MRANNGHKGNFGTVCVVGGCATMVGAPAIAARSAFRSGAGLVKLAMDGAVLGHALGIEPSATGVALTWPSDVSDMDTLVGAIDAADPDGRAVLAIGPGLGLGRRRLALVMALLRGKRAVVLDADGLNALAASGDTLGPAQAVRVLTPHPGEFRRLAQAVGIARDGDDYGSDEAARVRGAVALAQAHHAVVVLKGHRTVIADRDGQRVSINTTGNAAMATAGSGDVLTGIIAALIAQGMTDDVQHDADDDECKAMDGNACGAGGGYEAACAAVFAHGMAADRWVAERGPMGMLARELADELPCVWRALQR